MAKRKVNKFSLEGRVYEFETIHLDVEMAREILEDLTGLIYGDGDFYSQTIGILEAWKCCHRPEDIRSKDVVQSATFVIADGLADKTGGQTILTIGEEERLFVLVDNVKEPFVIDINQMMPDVLSGEKYDYSDAIKKITLGGNKVDVDSLKEQLKQAIAAEDYELCAKLRDKLKKKQRNKYTTIDPFGNRTNK